MSLKEFSELSDHTVHPRSVRKLPRAFCERHKVVILDEFERDPDTPVVVGMLDPSNTSLRLQIADLLQHPVDGVRLNAYEIETALEKAYGEYDDPDQIVIADQSAAARVEGPRQMLEHILSTAVHEGASDVHIERFSEDVDLRFRIDGILHQMYTDLNPDNVGEVIRLIKVWCNLDITEERRPQDGRLQCLIELDERGPTAIDFRISIVPAPAGEDVVIRVLDKEMGLLPVDALGMGEAIEHTFMRLLENPEGLILVTGPTGSGKTTTLYAALRQINDGRRKIITAEDPIEYDIDKICQKQVSEQMPLPMLLRALLRQDPDVMLIGEIRDQVTGDTALAAANTGHVVFATLHTADAIGTLARLRGLQLDRSELADALLAVLNQRLVRRLCTACAADGEASDAHRELFGELLDGLEVSEPVGCAECHHVGYRGRVGVFELLVVDRQMQSLIAQGVTSSELRAEAHARGHTELLEDALDKVGRGLTTLDEIERIVPYRQILAARNRAHSTKTSTAGDDP
jgi:general secretion pathway protein E